MKLAFFIGFFLCSFTASADFIIISRTGNLRESPSVNAPIFEKVTVGDTLVLIDVTLTNNYYHVTSLVTGQQGWVFRNLARRFSGDAGNANPDVNAIVEIRVVDVGAGLCNLIKLPNNKFVIYDAGGDKFLQRGDENIVQIKEYIPPGSDIELMVLSHTDADHILAAHHVIRNYNVKKVLWSGFEKSMITPEEDLPSKSFQRLVTALNDHPTIENVNLNSEDSLLTPGSNFNIGDVTFTFLCGFGKPPDNWDLINDGERLNSVSIVMKLEFAGNSVLFCGDAVGRHLNDLDENALIATEHFLVNNAREHLKSNVVIAPHHGAKNGSSRAFVELVKPDVVIFSAGHNHSHPTKRTADEYIRSNVNQCKIYRTDRGDDEGTSTEWNFERIAGHIDKFNNDHIHIQLIGNRTFRVFYVDGPEPCDQ